MSYEREEGRKKQDVKQTLLLAEEALDDINGGGTAFTKSGSWAPNRTCPYCYAKIRHNEYEKHLATVHPDRV